MDSLKDKLNGLYK